MEKLEAVKAAQRKEAPFDEPKKYERIGDGDRVVFLSQLPCQLLLLIIKKQGY